MLKYVDTVTFCSKTWTKGHWPLDDLWPKVCWGHKCDSTQWSFSPSPMKIHQSMWIQWPSGVARGGQGGNCTPWQKLCPSPLAPQMKLHFVQRSMESYHFESRSAPPPAHPSAPLAAPLILKSGYAPAVTLFSKTWTKGHWPLDDLWPQVCWGHMYNSTQGPLCPSSMGIHQCMWIQWSIL